MSSDGKNLYAGGANTSALVSQYAIGAGGALTALSPTSATSGGTNPLALALVPAQFLAPTIAPSSTSQSATSFTYTHPFAGDRAHAYASPFTWWYLGFPGVTSNASGDFAAACTGAGDIEGIDTRCGIAIAGTAAKGSTFHRLH